MTALLRSPPRRTQTWWVQILLLSSSHTGVAEGLHKTTVTLTGCCLLSGLSVGRMTTSISKNLIIVVLQPWSLIKYTVVCGLFFLISLPGVECFCLTIGWKWHSRASGNNHFFLNEETVVIFKHFITVLCLSAAELWGKHIRSGKLCRNMIFATQSAIDQYFWESVVINQRCLYRAQRQSHLNHQSR